METLRIIKRYNAYYHGWCLAFGEHMAEYQQDRDINWLFGEERVGLILSRDLQKRAQRELLGNRERVPELRLCDDAVMLNAYRCPLSDDKDRANIRDFREFLLHSRELHMFLSSHLFYPPRTRIITFARKKPLIIMYKEMQPLKLIIE
jgi:hypothetical protein